MFDPATAFGGHPWYADATADHLICNRTIEPLIMVGIYNTGIRRVSEYTPTRCPRRRKGGKAGRYAEMLAREIKPFIDHEYRTKKGAEHSGVGGSSLGALASLVVGIDYPRVFGRIAAISPSVWWDNRSIVGLVDGYKSTMRPRIWLDAGTEEGESAGQIIDDVRHLRDALVRKGWREGGDLRYSEIQGAGHNERAWAHRFGDVLTWLYPR